METLPDGVVTFLFTDVEGSTRLWEEAPDSMMEALRQHDEAIESAAQAHEGIPVRPRGEGDSRFIVFRSASDAVAGSAEMQRRLAGLDWVTPGPLRVRASIHTGSADLQLGDYYGSAVNRAARLRAIAHGGQTVLSSSTWELVRDELPDGVTILDMGQHRLKDLTRPEHVYQLNVEGLDHSFPPLVTLDAFANNLPQQLTDFIGRQSELAETKRLLGETRLLTVLAPGGMGKTRLAIQAAADLISDYPDGVFFVALADISASSDIVQTVAEAIGVALSSAEDPQTQLLGYLISRRLLLVFDNFEHVADGSGVVSELLKAAPGVTVIATSRAKLNLTGETVFTLAGLDTVWDTPEEALQTSGVRLFLDAAQRSQPGMSLETGDLVPLAEILRLTGGSPLGILLAAAWADLLSIRDIAAEIVKSLDFLETSVGDVPDRHRSVRAVFDYTWELLNSQEREVFAALSVFRGRFTKEAAEAVAAASLRDLANLAAKSLVTANPDTGRYTVHELLRQYAQAELDRDPARRDSAFAAHSDYYSALTDNAFDRMPEDQLLAFATIEEDIENIRFAWHHNAATNNGAGVNSMIRGLFILYDLRGWYQAAVPLFGDPLEVWDEDSNDEAITIGRALALGVQNAFLAILGRPEADAGIAASTVDLMRAVGDAEDLFLALWMESLTLLYQRRLDEAGVVIDEGLAMGEAPASAQPTGLVYWAAGLKNVRAFVALSSGDAELAVRLLDESQTVLEPTNDRSFMAWNLGHRARIAAQQGRLEDAIDLFSRSAEAAREAGFLRALQASLAGLGNTNLVAGDLSAAEAAFIEGLDAAERTRMVPEMLGTMTKIAVVLEASGRPREAVELLATVLAEPASQGQLFTETTPINEMASAQLEALQQLLGPAEYDEAMAAGSLRSYGIAAKELIDTI